MPSYRSSRGPMPDQPTLDAFVTHARSLPRPLPQVGHVRHDSQRPGAVYIGRRVFGLPDSGFGNPYRMPQDGDRAEVIAKYEMYARGKLTDDPHWLDALRDARVLTCWCRKIGQDQPACHGDVIIALLAEGAPDAR